MTARLCKVYLPFHQGNYWSTFVYYI